MNYNQNQRNILAIFYQASTNELLEGALWYKRANTVASHIAETYNVSLFKVCGVIAALSPRNEWTRNVIDAEALISMYVSGGSMDDIRVCTYNTNKAKAWTIMQGTDIEECLGRKQTAFYLNIATPDHSHDVTVDSHAYNVWLGEFNSIANTKSLSERTYNAVSQDYYFVANSLDLRAHQLQAICWLAYRRLRGLS